MAMRIKTTFLLTALGFLLFTSCSSETATTEPVLHVQIPPKVAVELPDIPNFDDAIAAAQPVDDVYSAWGLLYDQRKLIDHVVRVRGAIVDISDDCPNLTAPRKRRGRRPSSKCQELSVVIADDDNLHKIRVTGYHPYYHPHFKIGMELDVTGQYVKQARVLGMVAFEPEDGLIVAHRLHGMGVNRAGKFTTDRDELSQMIARGELLELKHAIKDKETE